MIILKNDAIIKLNIKKFEITLFLLFIFSFAYFFNGSGWNQESRMAQIYQIVEKQTLNINPYVNITQDIATYKENFYPNKPIGSTLLGVIPYFMIYKIENILKINIHNSNVILFNAYFVNFFANQLLAALASILFFRIIFENTLSYFVSLLITIAFALGSLFFPYTSVYMGHTQTVSLLIIGLYFFKDSIFKDLVISISSYFWGAFFISLSLITDFFALYIAAFFYIKILYHLIKGKNYSLILAFILGASIPILILAYYQNIVFGHFLNIPMKFNNPIFTYNNTPRIFGAFVRPKLIVLKELLFGEYYGIFTFSPVLILGITGIFYKLFNKQMKNRGNYFLTILLPVFISILSNISFIGWWGGSSIGPRYLINIIPLILLGCQFLIKFKWFKYLFIFLLLLGMYINLSIVASNPCFGKLKSIKYDILPAFLSGKMSTNETFPRLPIEKITSILKEKAAFNLGELLGLHGLISLLPLFILQLIIVFFLLNFIFDFKILFIQVIKYITI